MIIEAMDLLHSGRVDGYCLVSSDSDYTRLATRLRESGAFVMGIGRKTTPKPFTNACDLFVFLENLKPPTQAQATVAASETEQFSKIYLDDALPLLRRAFEMQVPEDGWAYLSSIGGALRSLDSSFDYRTFGCNNLRSLVESFPDTIEVREQHHDGGKTSILMRLK
jgi:hypothetical protein